MKRNMIPLLGVAFVVAIASTGIFYGLFVGKLKSATPQNVVIAAKTLRPGTVVSKGDVSTMAWSNPQIPKGMLDSTDRVVGQTVVQSMEEGEPVLESRLGSRNGKNTGIAEGMRAVSVHVSDSAGVLSLLRPGNKVDVQVFALRQGERGPETEARTAFQNISVLAVATVPEPSALGGFNAPVVTLLVNSKEADLLGVADSFGRVRLALRNPVDDAMDTKPTLPLAAVFRSSASAGDARGSGTRTTLATAPNPAKPKQQTSEVALNVELLSASPEALRELASLGLRGDRDVLDASNVADASNLHSMLVRLKEAKAIGVLSSSRVNAGMTRTAAVELRARNSSPSENGGVRVQFQPFLSNGKMRLKVQPEISTKAGARRSETELDISGGRSFFISGLADARDGGWLLDRWLGPKRTIGEELIVLVTPGLL